MCVCVCVRGEGEGERPTLAPPATSSISSSVAGGEEEGETQTEPAALKRQDLNSGPASSLSSLKNWRERERERWH